MSFLNSLIGNRKSNVNFIKPLHYLGNVFGVVPFYYFNRNIRKKTNCGIFFGTLLIALHIYCLYGFNVGMEPYKISGNVPFDLIAFALYTCMVLISIISILIFSIAHRNSYVKMLNKIKKIDS